MGGLLHLVQRRVDWVAQASPCCTKRNSSPTNGHCVPITVLLYNGPLLCDINVAVKGLRRILTELLILTGTLYEELCRDLLCRCL